MEETGYISHQCRKDRTEGKRMKRQHYVDNLRWILIALLLPVQAALAFNCWGEDFYIILDGESKGISSFYTMISPWIMSVLFLLAGMTMRYSLEKRTATEFAVNRLKRLGIPLVIGIFSIVAVLSYFTDVYNFGYVPGFARHYRVFLMEATDLTGFDGHFTLGHLWFLFFLLVSGLVALLVVMLQKRILPKLQVNNPGLIVLLLVGILPALGSYVGNIAGKSLVQYLLILLLGYYVFANEAVLEKLQNNRFLLTGIAVIGLAAYTFLFVWMERTGGIVEIPKWIGAWSAVLAVIAMARQYLNKSTIVTQHLYKISYAFYWLYLVFVVWVEAIMQQFIDAPVVLFLISVIVSFIVTYVVTEIVTLIPFIRQIFGVKKNHKEHA